MDYEQLDYDLEYAPCIRLLKSENAALIIRFLHQQFKQGHHVSLPLARLIEALEDDLEVLRIHNPGNFPRSAQAYIHTWADEQHQFIRIAAPMPGRNEQAMVELTADTERAIGWLDEMHQQPFVGTESRFLLVLQMIQDIVHRTTENPEQRLAQLEQQRNEIQRQIDDIRLTGKVDDRYTASQIRERFVEAGSLARQLLRDFHLVEDRFREIARSVQKKYMQSEARKGALVEYVLDADLALKTSDQGQSFYAFWDYLMAPTHHETLNALLEELHRLPDVHTLVQTEDILEHLPTYLITAGEQVVQSNYRLAEQLRHILDEQARIESRRIRTLAQQIEQYAHSLVQHMPDDAAFLEVEGSPDVSLVMERGLWEPIHLIPVDQLPQLAEADISNVDFARLHEQFFVDEAVIRERITEMLERYSEITLSAVLECYPLEKGLSELLVYYGIAAQNPSHIIDETQQETFPLFSSSTRTTPLRVVTLPKVLYRRSTNG